MAFAHTAIHRNKLYYILLNLFKKLCTPFRTQVLHSLFLNRLNHHGLLKPGMDTSKFASESDRVPFLHELRLSCGLSVLKDWIHFNRDSCTRSQILDTFLHPAFLNSLLDFHHDLYFSFNKEQHLSEMTSHEDNTVEDLRNVVMDKKLRFFEESQEEYMKKEGLLIQLTNLFYYLMHDQSPYLHTIRSHCSTFGSCKPVCYLLHVDPY